MEAPKQAKNVTWRSLKLEGWLQNMCRKIGFKEPTDIQKQAIPQIMKGNHVLGK